MPASISRRGFVAGAAALGSYPGLTACEAPKSAAPSDAIGGDDATALAERIAKGEVTSGDVLQAALARVAKVNPDLNFIATALDDYARTRLGQPLKGAFAGVPTLIKDLFDLAGTPTHYGSRAFAQNVARAQTPYMDRLLEVGLVPIGKSTTPEFGLTATTEPVLTGVTRNPWNPQRSTGGSSGGAAAAVASGAVPIAHASDGGGSIRIPASCCGLVGLKVSRGRHLPAGGMERGLALSVQGCLSRTVRDTALWFSLTENDGPDAAFPTVGLVKDPGRRRLRIGHRSATWAGEEPEPAVRAALEEVSNVCVNLGHAMIDSNPPIDGAAFAADFTLIWAANAADIADRIHAAAPRVPLEAVLEPLTLGLVEAYRHAPAGALDRALTRMQRVSTLYADMFSNIDVLLTPVLSHRPAAIGELDPTQSYETSMERLQQYVGYTPMMNVAGAPAISLPLSMSPDGLPIGAMFAGPPGGERVLLELAFELERADPWAYRRPQIWAG